MHESRAVSATSRLRQALEGAADALAQANVEALLASEGALEFALAEIPPMQQLAADERAAVREELERASRALLRCGRLGNALTDYVRLTFAAQAEAGHAFDYAPGTRDGDYAGRAINARA